MAPTKAVTKKTVAFSCDPDAWKTFCSLVEQRYGERAVSGQLEQLVRAEAARLSGKVDDFLNATIKILRELASGVKDPEPQKTLAKLLDGLEGWAKTNRGTSFDATDLRVDYSELQRTYILRCKKGDELTKILKDHGSYEGLKQAAKESGLVLSGDYGNAQKVIDKMLKASQQPGWQFSMMDLQLFINLIEVVKEKRALEKRLTEIQKKTYGEDENV